MLEMEEWQEGNYLKGTDPCADGEIKKKSLGVSDLCCHTSSELYLYATSASHSLYHYPAAESAGVGLRLRKGFASCS